MSRGSSSSSSPSGENAKEIARALKEAREKGLPDIWTVKIDRRRRKWKAPNGRTCESIPKAMELSIKYGWLPPDTEIPHRPKKRRKVDQGEEQKEETVASEDVSMKKNDENESESSSSDEEEGPSEEELAALDEPESDPEDSLNARPLSTPLCKPTTVHWDGNAVSKIGRRIRVWDSKQWRDGRCLLYDPHTHKHKIRFDLNTVKASSIPVDASKCAWLRLELETTQYCSRLVWAHVKGFAWWPGMVMEGDALDGVKEKKGHVLISFFGSSDVATLRDSPDCIKPFSPDDDTDERNHHGPKKKKRNARAVQLAVDELTQMQQVRQDASRHYAAKAFAFASLQSPVPQILSKRITLHRDDINYPYGETLTGRVRQYSSVSKLWLVSYAHESSSATTNKKYLPTWVDLSDQGKTNWKYVDRATKTTTVPTDEDLVPFMSGFLSSSPSSSSDDGTDDDQQQQPQQHDVMIYDDNNPNNPMTLLLRERCRGCVEYILDSHETITCTGCCRGRFHIGCLDPILNMKQRNKEFDDSFVCPRCTKCVGCWQQDVAFGSFEQHPSILSSSQETTTADAHHHHHHLATTIPSLHSSNTSKTTTTPTTLSLDLCTMCTKSYRDGRFCPNCLHTWNDVHYQRVKKQIQSNSKAAKALIKRRVGTDTAELIEEELEMPSNMPVESTWYFPDTPVWGYTAGTMLACEACDKWVHAGCASLTRDEYEETSNGEHAIYSKDFLCRLCCQKRIETMISMMQKEDKMFLFAIPVTPEMAPTYHDVIKSPMDLQTMMKRAKQEQPHKNYVWVKEGFELIVSNALTFNAPNTKYWLEAKRFYQECCKKIFDVMGKGAATEKPSRYAKSIAQQLEKAELAIKMEAERVQSDKTTEKKDLVAGTQVAQIVSLPPLRPPLDPSSCLPFTQVKLDTTEAAYCSWMECCFTCGSSGAADCMLYCVDCGEAFHSFCVGISIHSMEPSSVSGWRCPNCKICEISGVVPVDELKMIFCDMCDRAFSLELIDPPLLKAPTGLFVCGQCVDCKVCNNTLEKKKGTTTKGDNNITYWSRDPEKCFRCGGCAGLKLGKTTTAATGRQQHQEEDEYLLSKCVLCNVLLRESDEDIVTCQTCCKKIHLDCDSSSSAKEYHAHLSTRNGTRSNNNTFKYDCPRCRRKQAQHQHASRKRQRTSSTSSSISSPTTTATTDTVGKQLREQLHLQAWQNLLAEQQQQASNDSILELFDKLKGQIDWRIRNMWREDYVRLIQEGLEMVVMISQRHMTCSDLVGACKSGQLGELPVWMAQRAARFLNYVKHSHYKKDPIDASKLRKKDITTLVTLARMASAFLKVSCRSLGMVSKKTVHSYTRMASMLRAPDGVGAGTVEIPMDPVRVEGNATTTTSNNGTTTMIPMEEWLDKYEPHVDEQAKACPIASTIGKVLLTHRLYRKKDDVQQEENDDDKFMMYPMATPVIGWNHHLFTTTGTMNGNVASLKDDNEEERGHRNNGSTSSHHQWKDPRVCCLCRTCGDDEATATSTTMKSTTTAALGGSEENGEPPPAAAHMGRLLPMRGGFWIHAACALWSSEVYENEGTLHNVEKARSRGNQLKCFGCDRSGATVGCSNKSCSRNYHFACARACGGTFTTNQLMFCEEHKSCVLKESEIFKEEDSREQMKTLKIAEEKRAGGPIDREIDASGQVCSRVGGLIVLSLGTIEQSVDGFHSDRYIMPPGYMATRIYWSIKSPKTRTVYMLRIEKHPSTNAPVFSATPGDDPTNPIRAKSVSELYTTLVHRVRQGNREYFSHNDLYSKHPSVRKTNKKAFGLNGPQFFGFGLEHIRKALEKLPGVEAVVARIHARMSPSYRFSFVQPSKESIMALQRKRAAMQAERALENNSSGCARAEGTKAVTKSGGSGRITRALVRSVTADAPLALTRGAGGEVVSEEQRAKQRQQAESNRRKYREMKAVPLEDRLAARRSHIHGWGLFTKVDIPADGMIIEYMGEVVRQCVADRREREYEKLGIGSCYMFRLDLQRIVDATRIGCMARFMNHCCQPNAYAKVITVATVSVLGDTTTTTTTNTSSVGAGTTTTGATSSSSTNNGSILLGNNGSTTTGLSGLPECDSKIVVFAKRDIKAGEEITYDYKFPIEDGSLRCTCGAPNCIGRMN